MKDAILVRAGTRILKKQLQKGGKASARFKASSLTEEQAALAIAAALREQGFRVALRPDGDHVEIEVEN